MSVEITFAKIRRAAEELVHENGKDFTYSCVPGYRHGLGCTYVHQNPSGEDIPGCLVGQVLHRIGVPLRVLRRWNADTPSGTLLTLLEESEEISYADHDMREVIRRYLAEAQYRQDNGGTWGRALYAADLRAESWALCDAFPGYAFGCDCSECFDNR